LALFARE